MGSEWFIPGSTPRLKALSMIVAAEASLYRAP
jgi:hypothetical protein